MPVASSRAAGDEIPRPPIRIRTLLALALIGGFAWWIHPRAVAAWKLHAAASSLANYALCMVGPTGPALLRDKPDEFAALVRRRLVSADAGDRPFSECAKAAGELSGDVRVERAHRAQAWSFAEYGGDASDRAAAGKRVLSLSDLRVSARSVAELSEQAWPIIRDGWTRLVKPSLGAHEAVHPVEFAKPAIGRGLPNWRAHYRATRGSKGSYVMAIGRDANLAVFRTSDGGISWSPAPARGVSEIAERCAAGERGYQLSTSDDGRHTTVVSLGPDGPAVATPLTRSEHVVFAAACDEHALVAAVKQEQGRDVGLFICKYRDACKALPPPKPNGVDAPIRFPLDLARVDGTTIVAVSMHDVVRVASSRDDGRSWTPLAVAFDAKAHPDVRTHVAVPGRIVALGKRVLLYGGADESNQTYPVLISDDLGASWRRP